MNLKPEEKPYRMQVRFRTIGDMSCTGAVDSRRARLEEIIEEVASSRVTERGSRRMTSGARRRWRIVRRRATSDQMIRQSEDQTMSK
jgi:3'-phosphoadenosine 5'-phosphosulfate sulfotransferase (PAPS reductase)/FAD synthetase